MANYWLNPTAEHIRAWAKARWPGDSFSGWSLARLRAMWRRVNEDEYEMGKHIARMEASK